MLNTATNDQTKTAAPVTTTAKKRSTLRLVLDEGGPGFCQFALNNVCNARCGFCNFAVDKLPREQWHYVHGDAAQDAIDILYRQAVRYLVFTGGEPMLHNDLTRLVRHASQLGMKTMVVTNGSLLKPHRIDELADAGLGHFIISVDAASAAMHEKNRGLPGVCDRIREANQLLADRHELSTTASVTMSRLVDYEKLPAFLKDLGFRSVTFSYPLNELGSNFLGFSDSELVDHTKDELIEAFEAIKRLKKQFQVLNPTPSIKEMQRFLRGEEQRFPCLGGYQYFYLDWDLNLWRCHNWDTPMCSIYEFDGSQRVRDGCTRCMIDCYRDSSTMQHIGVSLHDTYQALRAGKLRKAAESITRKGNMGSIQAIMEELPWLLKF